NNPNDGVGNVIEWIGTLAEKFVNENSNEKWNAQAHILNGYNIEFNQFNSNVKHATGNYTQGSLWMCTTHFCQAIIFQHSQYTYYVKQRCKGVGIVNYRTYYNNKKYEPR